MRQTTMANKATVEQKWFVVDATNQTLGRLASEVATVLRGKHKPSYTPHVDCGDNVIIINADKIQMTSNKLDKVFYYRHSGYIGGLKVTKARDLKENNPIRFVESAIQGMLPHTRLGRAQAKKLYVYVGNEHPHGAQKPTELKIKG